MNPNERPRPRPPTHSHLVVEASHEVEHGVGVAQPLRRHVEKLDGRLPSLVAPGEVLVDLLDRRRRRGARHVGGRDASAGSLAKQATSGGWRTKEPFTAVEKQREGSEREDKR